MTTCRGARFVERHIFLTQILSQLPQFLVPLVLILLASATERSLFESALYVVEVGLALLGPFVFAACAVCLRRRRGLSSWPVLLLTAIATLQILCQMVALAAIADAMLPSWYVDSDVEGLRISELSCLLAPNALLFSGMILQAAGLFGFLVGRIVSARMARKGRWRVSSAEV